jgi:hypothetical protein
MPYQHCPSCRLTVHIADRDAAGDPCPRCGTALADEPRSLFAVPRTPSPALLAARRGGRHGHSRAHRPGPSVPVTSFLISSSPSDASISSRSADDTDVLARAGLI